MADLATLTSWRDVWEAARFKGVLSVRFGDRLVTYRSDGEMRDALGDLDRKIQAAQGTGPLREVRIKSSKGL